MPKNKAISAIIIEPNVNSVMRSWNRSEYVTYMISPSLHKRGTKKKNGFTLSVIDREEREPPTVLVCLCRYDNRTNKRGQERIAGI